APVLPPNEQTLLRHPKPCSTIRLREGVSYVQEHPQSRGALLDARWPFLLRPSRSFALPVVKALRRWLRDAEHLRSDSPAQQSPLPFPGVRAHQWQPAPLSGPSLPPPPIEWIRPRPVRLARPERRG